MLLLRYIAAFIYYKCNVILLLFNIIVTNMCYNAIITLYCCYYSLLLR